MKRLLTLFVLALAVPAQAAAPQFWRVEGASGFLKGDLEDVSLDSEARLRLGRAVSDLFDPETPNAWALAADPDGSLAVGTGNDGHVYRVSGKQGRVILDASELEVHAVAVGPDGRVYAGTSPDGAVHVIEPDGSSRVLFDPPDTYIWALAVDGKGRLLVATGDEGHVYRVSADGSSETLLETSETHVLSLVAGPGDTVFAGSSPEGIVYRIDAPGRAFVVLDSAYREVKALALGENGAILAAVVGGEASTSPPPAATPPAAAAPSPTPVAEVTVSETFAVAPTASAPAVSVAGQGASASASPKGAVIRVDPDGRTETLWTSTEDVPHSLLRTGHSVLVGTGSRGNVYRVDDDATWALVAHAPARQVTALASAPAGGAILVTSNPGRVFALAATNAPRGTWTSDVHDTETVSAWGQLRWEGHAPDGTRVRVETRSGNTSGPDSTWGDWTAVGDAARQAPVRSESARYLQVRLTLEGTAGDSPEVEAVSAAFLQRNLRPEVTTVTVHPPGEVFQKPISVSGEPEILGLAPDPQSESGADRSAPGTPPATSFSRKMQQKGLRTFSWTAEDDNHDALVYQVQYRAVGDERWRLLRQGLTEPVLAWDTSAVPDGRYVIRVTASDSPDNPPSVALTGHRDSRSFEVDNAPPALEASLVSAATRRVRVRVTDTGSAIHRLEYSVDAGRWQEVHPVDGISDSLSETYEFTLPAVPGPRVVVLRASDLLGNVATGRVDVP